MKDFFFTSLFIYFYFFTVTILTVEQCTSKVLSLIHSEWTPVMKAPERWQTTFKVKVCDGVPPNWRRQEYGLGDIGRVKEFQSTTA